MMVSESSYPVLYTNRRCPYCIRARIALYRAGVTAALREVDLRDKPDALLDISTNGYLPVLVLPAGKVIEDSLEIMKWALGRSDPAQWLVTDQKVTAELITRNDESFASALQNYREKGAWGQDAGLETLKDLEKRLSDQRYLTGNRPTLADIALFPFVRQFALIDRAWFDGLPLSRVHQWLAEFDSYTIFQAVMNKVPLWKPSDTPVLLAPFNPRSG